MNERDLERAFQDIGRIEDNMKEGAREYIGTDKEEYINRKE